MVILDALSSSSSSLLLFSPFSFLLDDERLANNFVKKRARLGRIVSCKIMARSLPTTISALLSRLRNRLCCI